MTSVKVQHLLSSQHVWMSGQRTKSQKRHSRDTMLCASDNSRVQTTEFQ